MYSTDKEVHVYLDAATQQMASNRKQSILPQYLDMFLNNAMIEYIISRFPNGRSPKDIEQTLRAYTLFSNLKTNEVGLFELVNNEGLITKPHNAIKIQTVHCNYVRPFAKSHISVGRKYVGVLSINDNIYLEDNVIITIILSNGKVSTKTINISNYVKTVKTKNGVFYIYDSLLDILNNIYKINTKFVSLGEDGNKQFLLDFPIGTSILELSSNSPSIKTSFDFRLVDISKVANTKESMCSILTEYEAGVQLSDYYGKSNLHLDPVVTFDSEYGHLRYTDFLPCSYKISYLKKPRRFDINTGQIPEIDITKEFLDYTVKAIMLSFKDGSYDKLLNENIKNE